MLFRSETESFYINSFKVVYNCLYSAFCDLKLFKDIFSFHNRAKGSHKGGYTRNSGFRVAHTRRLPIGAKASAESLANAKKEGFYFIPEGHTFVKASSIDTTKQKIITIK